MPVAHILNQKGRSVITVSPDQSLQDVAQVLARHRIGAVVVAGPDGEIAGILSERDVVKAIAAEGGKALSMKARDAMTAKVRTCSPGDTESELMSMMTEHRIRHLPVVEKGKLAGMISIGDVVKLRIETMEREASEMKSYIASAG